MGAPLAEDETTKIFEADQSFGDVMISVTGKMLTFYETMKQEN